MFYLNPLFLFLIFSLPIWFAGTVMGWLVWYMNPDAHWGVFVVFQLVGFVFAIPSVALNKANIGAGVVIALISGYFIGKNVTKL